MGVGVSVFVARALRLRRQRRRANPPESERILGELLLSALTPDFREYLQSSNAAAPVQTHDELGAKVDRIANIWLRRPRSGTSAMSLDEVAVGLALLESKL